jgi:hypothetical protein
MKNTIHSLELDVDIFSTIVQNWILCTHREKAHKCLKLFRTSILPLWGKELKDLLISNISADNVLPTSYGLSATSVSNETMAGST